MTATTTSDRQERSDARTPEPCNQMERNDDNARKRASVSGVREPPAADLQAGRAAVAAKVL